MQFLTRLSFLVFTCVLTSLGSAHALVIGGFDTARAGDANFESGSVFSDARNIISTTFPCVTLTSFNALSDVSLAGVDVVILPTGVNNGGPITPLTQAEQDALFDFVSNGGAALLMPDNDTFGGGPAPPAEPTNESLIDPFGLDITGTLAGDQAATTAGGHPVINGFYGAVPSFTTSAPGWFDALGPFATPLATLDANGETCMAVIAKSALAPGSGGVVLTSDVEMWTDPAHDVLLQNTIEFLAGGCPVTVQESTWSGTKRLYRD